MVDISALYTLKRSSLFSISYAFYWPFTTILLQQTALAAHSWEQLLQQSPHPSMQPLHPALRSSSVLSLQDTSQFNHLELEIYDC